MAKTAKTLTLRSADKKHLAGSQSLGGKKVSTPSNKTTLVKGTVSLGDTEAKVSAINKHFDELRRKERSTFRQALKEFDMEYWKTPADKDEALAYAASVNKRDLAKIENKRHKALADPDIAITKLGLNISS
jgi:hypothetical protein